MIKFPKINIRWDKIFRWGGAFLKEEIIEEFTEMMDDAIKRVKDLPVEGYQMKVVNVLEDIKKDGIDKIRKM